MLKCIHLLAGTLLFALILISYAAIIATNRRNTLSLQQAGLKFALSCDAIVLPLLIISFISGTLLTPIFHFTPATPWIQAAYRMLGLVLICWIALTLLHWRDYRSIKAGQFMQLKFQMHVLYILVIIFIILIIHDAVTKTTYWVH